MNENTNIELILSKIDDLSERMEYNFKEIYSKLDHYNDRHHEMRTDLELVKQTVEKTFSQTMESMQRFGERLGDNEKQIHLLEKEVLIINSIKKDIDKIKARPFQLWKWIGIISGTIISVSGAVAVLAKVLGK